MALKRPILPADRQVADEDGRLTDPYWLFLDSIQRNLREGDDGVTVNGEAVTY